MGAFVNFDREKTMWTIVRILTRKTLRTMSQCHNVTMSMDNCQDSHEEGDSEDDEDDVESILLEHTHQVKTIFINH